ncbi:unnamed protein product [Coregonus sp. 'balchen']|nr:unnamed protein product [Coregonus sp. 'balchen']
MIQLNAKAEIICSLCPSPVQLHLEELQLDTGTRAAAGRSQAAKASEQSGVSEDEPRFTYDGVSAKVALEGSTRCSENERAKRSRTSMFSESLRTGGPG